MRIVLTLFLFCVCVSIKAQQQNMTEMKKAIDLMQRMYDITFVYDSSLVTAKPQAFPSAGNSLKENLERIFGGTDINGKSATNTSCCSVRTTIPFLDMCVKTAEKRLSM